MGAPPDDVVLAPPHTVLKTSSGKIRRAACSELYQRGMTGAGPRALWAQSLRLAWLAAAGGLRRLLARWAAILYGVYAWALLVPIGFFAVILAVALPRLAWRRHVAAVLARALASACGLRIHVTGAGHFPDKGAIALATNHASYLDGLVLTGVIPERCVFVAKRELADHFLARVLLDGIGTRYVERFDLERSVEAAHEMARIAAQGESLVFFPEGTLRREPGLLPFHMGGFVAAASAGTSVIPVTLRGTRLLMPDGQWLPRRGVVQVIIGSPAVPDGRDWAAAVRLRDLTRAAILAACGEPDMVAASGRD